MNSTSPHLFAVVHVCYAPALLCLFLCPIVFSGTASPQQPRLDSLYSVWQDQSLPDSARAGAFKDYIWDGFLYSKPDTASILAEEMIAFGKKSGYLKAQALGSKMKGAIFSNKGDYSQGLDYFAQSQSIFEQLGDQKGLAYMLDNIGLIYSIRGDYPKALQYYTEGLNMVEQMGDQKAIASALYSIGTIYQHQGDYPKALDYFTQGMKMSEQLGFTKGIANALISIGYICQIQGDHPKALDCFTQSLKINEQLGNQHGIAITRSYIGHIYANQDDTIKALDYYTQALNIFEELGHERSAARMLMNIGNIYDQGGDKGTALEYLTQSLKILQQLDDQNGIGLTLLNMGAIYSGLKDYSKSLDYYQQGLEIFEKVGNQDEIAHSLINIGGIQVKEGDHERALLNCQKGYDLALSLGSQQQQKSACKCLYDAYKALGKGNEALVYLEKMGEIDKQVNKEETAKQLERMEFRQVMLQDSIAKADEARLVREAHQAEVRQKNQARNIALGGGLFFLLLAGGFYSRWRYVRKSRDIISKERDRSENLLLNILPAEIAAELKEKGRADARDFEMVSILFTDFKNFTEQSATMSAAALVNEINYCFEAFDQIMEKYSIEKIKTIGDAYMAAGGLPVPTDDSVKNTVLAALDMQAFIAKRKAENQALGKPAFVMRVGIHTGPVVAGIVGVKKFQYDIWGDTVNTASRMESSGEVGKVNISQSTYELLKHLAKFNFESRGKIAAKGKGEIEMYFVSVKNNIY